MGEIGNSFLNTRLLSGVAALALGWASFKALEYKTRNKSSVVYPPSPPREFVIGTLRSFPNDHYFRQFCQWGAAYGEIVYAPLPGMDIVILNSHEIAQELLSKRPSSTAGRQVGYFVADLMNWGWNIGLIQAGPSHSNQRKMLRKSIGPQRISSYYDMIETEMAKLTTVLHKTQGNPADVIKRALTRMVTKATYGERLWDDMGDVLSEWNLEAMDIANEHFFAFWIVDIIPLLRFVPSWFPGAHFQRIAQRSRYLVERIRYRAYTRVQELFNAGTLGHCIANDLMAEFGPNEDARDALAMLPVASDATTAAVIAFFHAMFLFPDIAERVFEEIQTVTSGERLPLVTDRPHLPFSEAVWKEALRWNTFLPLGNPHVNNQDEIVHGYLIPKGSMIHQNFGLMLNDPKVWGDPEVFRPDRFLEPEAAEKPNPSSLLFGYGVRICPGMYLADKLSFHLGITVVALLKIVPLEGCKVPDPNTIEYTDAGIRYPIGFECRFIPRSERTEQLLSAVSLSE